LLRRNLAAGTLVAMYRRPVARGLSAALLIGGAVVACTPFIPVKDDFGVSATLPAGNLPPDFAEFNAYNPAVATLLADQVCATPYVPLEDKNLAASGGRILQAKGRCATHRPLFGN
jgi:hypothetical protein